MEVVNWSSVNNATSLSANQNHLCDPCHRLELIPGRVIGGSRAWVWSLLLTTQRRSRDMNGNDRGREMRAEISRRKWMCLLLTSPHTHSDPHFVVCQVNKLPLFVDHSVTTAISRTSTGCHGCAWQPNHFGSPSGQFIASHQTSLVKSVKSI